MLLHELALVERPPLPGVHHPARNLALSSLRPGYRDVEELLAVKASAPQGLHLRAQMCLVLARQRRDAAATRVAAKASVSREGPGVPDGWRRQPITDDQGDRLPHRRPSGRLVDLI
jgi:hypothetical protein